MRKRKSINLPKSAPKNLDSARDSSDSLIQRFEKSMVIDYEKWHEGISYDLDAIKLASPKERKIIEQILINHNPWGWRDIEALAQLGTKIAREAIRNAMNDPNIEVRIAVTRFAPNLLTSSERSRSLVEALQNAEIFSGLSHALDEVEEHHPTEVKEALIKGLLSRGGDVAVLFAAMLFYIYGKAIEPFDMEQRPFFLRFNTDNRAERVRAFLELCKQLNINPEKYFTPKDKLGTTHE